MLELVAASLCSQDVFPSDANAVRHPLPLTSMTVDLGTAQSVDAESFGQPGERTFRLRIIGAGKESASLWVEKEHLQALSLAFSQILSQFGRADASAGQGAAEFPQAVDHDLRIGRMGIGFDPADRSFVLQVYELESDEDASPALNVRLRLEHCAALNGQLIRIISAGRPVCPLCGSPVNADGHACVRANGHSQQPIPEQRVDEEEEE